MISVLRSYYYKLLKRKKQLFDPRERKYQRAIVNDLADTKNVLKNLKPYSDFSEGSVLIISFSNLPFLIKVHSFLGYLFAKKKFKPVLLTYSGCTWAKIYAHLFHIENIVYWDKYVRNFGEPGDDEVALVDALLSDDFGSQKIKNFTYQNIYIGRHTLSTIIRNSLSGRFDLHSTHNLKLLREQLLKAITAVKATRQLVQDFHVKNVIVRDAGYFPNGTIYEVGLDCGLDAIRFESAQMLGHWQVKRYNPSTKGQALFSLSPDTWSQLKNIPLSLHQQQLLETDFAERYDPDSKKDLYKYQLGKRDMNPDETRKTLGIKSGKKVAIVFSHITWDANFFDGEDIFDNFEDWLIETVKLAIRNPNLYWVIKLHPANVYKLKREGAGVTRETELDAIEALGPLPDYVRIMRANNPINTWSLIAIADYGLTVRGTIGMELPCFGIPTVTAGTGRFDRYGFTIDPSTRAEYEDCLINLHTVPRLSGEVVELAKRHAYWVFLKRTACFDEVAKMTSNVLDDPNHPLHHNFILKRNFLQLDWQSPQVQSFSKWLADSNNSDFISN